MNIIKRVISFLLCLTMLLGTFATYGSITASAICCRKDYFDKSKYTLTGNMAHDVAVIAKSQKGRTCDDFGYTGVDYGGWCDEFCADCIENAGGDSSIVAHGSTVANFESVMRGKGAVTVTSPQEGDLIFFSNLDHVEIVTKVVNGEVYCAGGNNSGAAGGMCKGERAITGWGTPRCYLRPNYPSAPTTPPQRATISINKRSFAKDETVTFTIDSDGVTNTLWIVKPDGTSSYWENVGTRCELGFGWEGHYQAFVQTWNGIGSKISNTVDFVVGNPTYATVTLNKRSFAKDEIATFTIDTDGEVNNLWIVKPDGTSSYWENVGTKCELGFGWEGHYQAFVQTWNGVGARSSERIDFVVGSPTYATVALNKYSFAKNEVATFTINSDGETNTLWIVKPDGTRSYWENAGTSYNLSFSVEGHYQAFVQTWNGVGARTSETIDFVVGNPIICEISINKNNYSVNENVSFSFVTDGTVNDLWVYYPDGSSHAFYNVGNSYTLSFSDEGQYQALVQTWNDNGSNVSERVTFVVGSPKYTLTYNANGGTGAPQSYTGSGNVVISNVRPTCSDIIISPTERYTFSFLGWSTNSNSLTAQYQPGDTIYLSNNTTLYAVWSVGHDQEMLELFTLTYNANGGKNPPAKQTTTNGSLTLSSAKPTRSGYTFLGWATTSNAKEAQFKPGTAVTIKADVTLYAVWKINSTANAKINVAGTTTLSYRTIVTIKATATNLDPAYRLVLVVDGKEIKGDNKEVSYEYGEITNDINYSVKIVDASGKIQKDGSGKDLKKNGGTITCNAGFFQKLIAFFQGLFSMLPRKTVKP